MTLQQSFSYNTATMFLFQIQNMVDWRTYTFAANELLKITAYCDLDNYDSQLYQLQFIKSIQFWHYALPSNYNTFPRSWLWLFLKWDCLSVNKLKKS